VLVNHSSTAQTALQARIRVRDFDGKVLSDIERKNIDLPANTARHLDPLPKANGISVTYFVELELQSAHGETLSRNVYWLSTRPDRLDWANSNWYLTPLTQYADFTALQSLPAATSEVKATTRREGSEAVTSVTLTNPASAKTVALFQHAAIRKSAQGDFLAPILWSDNDVTLWPGESVTLTARYAAPEGAATVVEVNGWNIATQAITLDAANH